MSAGDAKPARRRGFTMVHDGVPALLRDRRASGTEVCVLLELMRYQRPDGTFSRPRRDVAKALGMTEDYVKKAVRSLAAKRVISCVAHGHKGKASVYELTRQQQP